MSALELAVDGGKGDTWHGSARSPSIAAVNKSRFIGVVLKNDRI